MAIAFDSSSSNSGGTASWNHTVSGTNTMLFVGVATAGGDSVTSLTFDSVSMTQLTSFASGARVSYLYYLINPNTGTHTVNISLNLGNFVYGSASSYTGVLQSSPIDVNNTNTSTSVTSQNSSITTTVDNCWVIETACGTSQNLSAGTSTTLRGSAGRIFNLFDSNTNKTPAGTVTLQTTTSIADIVYTIMASFKPVVTNTGNFFLVM